MREGTRGVSREAQAGVQGAIACEDRISAPAPLGRRLRVPLRRRRLALQRGDHRQPARRRAPPRSTRPARAGDVQVFDGAGRLRASAGGARRRRNRPLRRGRLPRLRHPRRDAALRIHLVGGGARHHRRRGRHRRADGVRRADDRHAGAGGRRAPAPAATTRGAKRRRRRSRWPCSTARCARAARSARPGSAHERESTAPARHRAREAALQMLYRGRSGARRRTKRSAPTGPGATRRRPRGRARRRRPRGGGRRARRASSPTRWSPAPSAASARSTS